MKLYVTALAFLILNKAASQTAAAPSLQHLSKEDLAKIKEANIKKAAITEFRYFIIKADSNTYGYSIYADGNLYIRQNAIPALPGKKGFADTTAAGATARLVIKKIKDGEMPPAITRSDLKKLKIIQ